MQLRMKQEDEKIHSSFTLFYIVSIFKNHGQVILTITVKCFCYKVFCSPSAYWAQALSCRNYLFSPLNPFLHEKQNKRIIFPCPVKVCSCPLSLPVVEPEEISQIGSEKEADDSAFRGGKHMSDSIHQHINLQLYIHLRLCLLFSGEPWASDLIFQTSLSIKWGNVMVSLRRLNETLYFQVKCLAGASCYLPRHKALVKFKVVNSKNNTTYKIRFEIAWCTAIEWALFHMGILGSSMGASESQLCDLHTRLIPIRAPSFIN